MFEIRKVLCPIDFSHWSEAAMHYAASMSKRMGSELTLLHVRETPAFATVPAGKNTVEGASIEQSIQLLQGQVEQALASAKATLDAGREIVTRIADGEPEHTIAEMAANEGFDLVIMGTQGRTGISRILAGSVSEHVVRLAPCPVLIVPNPKL